MGELRSTYPQGKITTHRDLLKSSLWEIPFSFFFLSTDILEIWERIEKKSKPKQQGHHDRKGIILIVNDLGQCHINKNAGIETWYHVLRVWKWEIRLEKS